MHVALFLRQTVQDFLGRIRKMARTIAKTFVAERESLGFPLLKD